MEPVDCPFFDCRTIIRAPRHNRVNTRTLQRMSDRYGDQQLDSGRAAGGPGEHLMVLGQRQNQVIGKLYGRSLMGETQQTAGAS